MWSKRKEYKIKIKKKLLNYMNDDEYVYYKHNKYYYKEYFGKYIIKNDNIYFKDNEVKKLNKYWNKIMNRKHRRKGKIINYNEEKWFKGYYRCYEKREYNYWLCIY